MFELFKAKQEARAARREAIQKIDQHIKKLATDIPNTDDRTERKEIEAEISNLVAIKEVYRKNVEIPKWVSESIITLVSTGAKIGGVIFTIAVKEKLMNLGTGDRNITNGIDQIMK